MEKVNKMRIDTFKVQAFRHISPCKQKRVSFKKARREENVTGGFVVKKRPWREVCVELALPSALPRPRACNLFYYTVGKKKCFTADKNEKEE